MNSRSSQDFRKLLRPSATSARYLAALFPVSPLAVLFAFGQEATIVGTVTDPSGSVVPNVTITITTSKPAKPAPARRMNGPICRARSADRPLQRRRQGYWIRSAETNRIVLNVNDRTRIDFVLKVGTAQENVTVEANAVQVQTDSGEVSTVITGQQISELGVNGRSMYSLFALTPGASSIQADFIIPTPVSGDSNVSINGQRAGHNLQLLDGGENLDRGGSSASVMPSMDAIAEFRDMTSNYSAEYGLSGGRNHHDGRSSPEPNSSMLPRGGSAATTPSMRATTSTLLPKSCRTAIQRLWLQCRRPGSSVQEHPTFFFYNMEWRSIDSGRLVQPNGSVCAERPYGGDFPACRMTMRRSSLFRSGAHNLSPTVPVTVLPGQDSYAGSAVPRTTRFPIDMFDPNAQALLKAGIFPRLSPRNQADAQFHRRQ